MSLKELGKRFSSIKSFKEITVNKKIAEKLIKEKKLILEDLYTRTKVIR